MLKTSIEGYYLDELNIFPSTQGVGFMAVLKHEGVKIADVLDNADGGAFDVRITNSSSAKKLAQKVLDVVVAIVTAVEPIITSDAYAQKWTSNSHWAIEGLSRLLFGIQLMCTKTENVVEGAFYGVTLTGCPYFVSADFHVFTPSVQLYTGLEGDEDVAIDTLGKEGHLAGVHALAVFDYNFHWQLDAGDIVNLFTVPIQPLKDY